MYIHSEHLDVLCKVGVIVVVEWLWRQHKAWIETVFIVYSNLLSGTHQEEYKRKNKTISEGETRINSLSSLNLSLQLEKESSGFYRGKESMINDVLYWETVGYVKGLHISLYVKEKYIPKISMVM